MYKHRIKLQSLMWHFGQFGHMQMLWGLSCQLGESRSTTMHCSVDFAQESSNITMATTSDEGLGSCKVCTRQLPDGGTEKVHYGAQSSCNTCRTFFWRATSSGAATNLKCRNHGQTDRACIIDLETINICKKCRWDGHILLAMVG